MKAIIQSLSNLDDLTGHINVTWGYLDGSTVNNINNQQVDVSTVQSAQDLRNVISGPIIANVPSGTITANDILGLPFPIAVRTFVNPSLAVNTSRQPSTAQDTMVNAVVDITTTLSLTGGSAGKVALQYADNTGFTTNVVTVQSYTNSNTGTLTIGLNTSQIGSASLTGIVPAGKYYRLVTTNVTGTPTYGTPVIQEVLL